MATSSDVQEYLVLNGLKDEILPGSPKIMSKTQNQGALQFPKTHYQSPRLKYTFCCYGITGRRGFRWRVGLETFVLLYLL